MEDKKGSNSNEERFKNQREKVQKRDLNLSIYEEIQNGTLTRDILFNLEIKKSLLSYYTTRLKGLGLIYKVGYGVWGVTKNLDIKEVQNLLKVERFKLSSVGTSQRTKSNLHALQIKIPILSGKINDKEWIIKEKLKNWTPKYQNLQELGGLRIKNNNNKSITIWAKEREVENVDEIHKLTHTILIYLGSYMKVKYGVVLDTINAEVKNLDIATEDKQAESMRGKGEKYTLKLNKDCEKILPNDKNKPAKAWIDGSPFNFSAETNDLEWKREYLNMPFNIKHLIYSLPALEEYNKNLKLHIKVQEEQLKTQKELQKLLKKLNK